MNLTNLKIDNSKEIPLSKKKKVKKPIVNNIKHRKKAQKTLHKKTRRSNGKTKIDKLLKKKLKRFDKHHIKKVNEIINSEAFVKKNLVPITNLKCLSDLCRTCDHCIRAINYCTVFRDQCDKSSSYMRVCGFKTKIKR